MKKNSRNGQWGMTFMEIMIVISILAIISSGVIIGFTSLSHARLRSSAYFLASAVQRALSIATSRNENVRLVINFEENTIAFESTGERFLIDRDNPQIKKGEKDEEAENSENDDLTKKKGGGIKEETEVNKNRSLTGSSGTQSGSNKFELGVENLAEKIRSGFHEGEVPKYKPPKFNPLKDNLLGEKKLESGVRFFAVYSQMIEDEIKEGTAYIYFFPDGTVDHTAIQIAGKSGEIFTVEILPSGARTKIYNYPYVPDFNTE